jgi:excisionase family DNA binding protein
MTNIVQLDYNDLQTAIKNCMRESIEEIKSIPSPAPLPDRMTLSEACELTNQSKSQLYKMTMLSEIPFQKYGKKLVFSRKKLLEWMESRTVSPLKDTEIITGRVSEAAKKHLKK